MFPATSMGNNPAEEEVREIDSQTTSSWLAAGIYVPPMNFPELVDNATRSRSNSSKGASRVSSRLSKGSKASRGSSTGGSIRNNSSKGLVDDDVEADLEDGFGDIKFIGGPETVTDALVLTTTPPRGGGDPKKSSPSPTSTVEEQLKTLHESFGKALFGCQEDATMLANAESNAKKNTRSYRSSQSQNNNVSRGQDKLTSNLSLFHTFSTACACIAEDNAKGLSQMISGASVIGFEERKDDESLPGRGGARNNNNNNKKKTKKRRNSGPNKQKKVQSDSAEKNNKKNNLIPMKELIVGENSSPHEVSRGVSELTMRSSYARAHAPVPTQRRMAYYAVGKHSKQNNSSRGGNRRCYYSGKLIVGDNPFYAGCVKQGLRTLVVFCLPSALGLTPKEKIKPERKPSFVKGILTRSSSRFSNTTSSTTVASDSASSSLAGGAEGGNNEEDYDFDINSRFDKDYLLSILPEASDDLLILMQKEFPSEYRTLPEQVRTPDAWGIYIQFCFFSGLPIAEGECYYMIKSEISKRDYGESIVLCHAIMEAVNGSSSDMVRLPNLKTFQYLRKHYPQQSDKLPPSAFERSSWEVVLPEI